MKNKFMKIGLMLLVIVSTMMALPSCQENDVISEEISFKNVQSETECGCPWWFHPYSYDIEYPFTASSDQRIIVERDAYWEIRTLPWETISDNGLNASESYSISPTSGTGYTPITLTLPENNNIYYRLGRVAIKDADGVDRDTLTFKQLGSMFIPSRIVYSATQPIGPTFEPELIPNGSAVNGASITVRWASQAITLRNNGKLKISIRKKTGANSYTQKQELVFNTPNDGVHTGTLNISGSWTSSDEYVIALVDVKAGSNNIVLAISPIFHFL